MSKPMKVTCEACFGLGEGVKDNQPCTQCGGEGVVYVCQTCLCSVQWCVCKDKGREERTCPYCEKKYRAYIADSMTMCPACHDPMTAAIDGHGKDPGREHREKAETDGEGRGKK